MSVRRTTRSPRRHVGALLALLGFAAGKGCCPTASTGCACTCGPSCGGGCGAGGGAGRGRGGCNAPSFASSVRSHTGRLGDSTTGVDDHPPCLRDAACDARDAGHDASADAPEGSVAPACPARLTGVFIVSDERGRDGGDGAPHLRSYDPGTGAFSDLGAIRCAPAAPLQLLALAVDRAGDAWIVADDGAGDALWRVSTLDAACAGTTPLAGTLPSTSATPVALAVVADTAAGDPTRAVYAEPGVWSLLAVDPIAAAVSPLARFTPSPSAQRVYLTGTPDGLLYAYEVRLTDPTHELLDVVTLDRATGDGTRVESLDPGDPRAIAGAVRWAGEDLVFLAGTPAALAIRRAPAGSLLLPAVDDLGFAPWAVAVSPCAPDAPPL